MAKLFIAEDEWYPFFTIDNSYGVSVEISDDLLERYQLMMQALREIQAELRKLIKAASDNPSEY